MKKQYADTYENKLIKKIIERDMINFHITNFVLV